MGFFRAELVVKPSGFGREYTTDPPRYVPYTVWSVEFELSCEVPFRVVRLLEHGEAVRWGMDGEAESSISESARFHPNDWLNSDDVHISFGRSTWITDAELKKDPQEQVELYEPEAATGEVVPLAAAPRHGLTLSVMAFAHDDTQDRRLEGHI